MPIPSMLQRCAEIGREIYNNPSLDKCELCFSEAKRLHEQYGWDEDEVKRLIMRSFVSQMDI